MLIPVSMLPLQFACQLLISRNYSSLIDAFNTSTPFIKSAAELPDGYAVFADIGVAYKIHQTGDKLKWNEARKYCEVEGGNLAIIDSLKKIEYVKGMGLNDNNAWVGIHRFFGNDDYMSIKHGSLATPLPWRSVSFRSDSTSQCVAVTAGSDAGLFVASCTEWRYFICEVSIFKDGGQVLSQSLQLN